MGGLNVGYAWGLYVAVCEVDFWFKKKKKKGKVFFMYKRLKIDKYNIIKAKIQNSPSKFHHFSFQS